MGFKTWGILGVVSLACLVEQAAGHGKGEAPEGYKELLQSQLLEAGEVPSLRSFVNFETPHVHPIDINRSGTKLAAVNTAGAVVEIYNISPFSGRLSHAMAVPVGYDPVSARWRTDTELWVVNQVSDSISIVNACTGHVSETIVTYRLADGDGDGLLEGSPNGDEPADVVFGHRGKTPVAVVSCSRTDVLQVYTLSPPNLTAEIRLDGEDPRALAINTHGTDRVYAAIFESGNSSTFIAGLNDKNVSFPPSDAALNLKDHTDHPYYVDGPHHGMGQVFAVNPPPNDGLVGPAIDGSYVAGGQKVSFRKLLAKGIAPPNAPIIVKKDFADRSHWVDDNGADWSIYVNGSRATESGRFPGWDLLDNDIGIQPLDEALTTPTYATRQMNLCMALGINPAGPNAGRVYLVGTDAINEVRFEPNLNGIFCRVMLSITEADGKPVALVDLNEAHLDAAQSGPGTAYKDSSVPRTHRNKSIGDPRGVAFSRDGATVYISGMGSNNLVVVNSTTGARVSKGHTVEVGHGPTGLVHHPRLNRLYVLNKFEGSISVVNTSTPGKECVQATYRFYDPTPASIKEGRVHFYGTHENSGLGHVSCASCHPDGRMDRLAWDLGNPAAILDESGEIPEPPDDNFQKIQGYEDGLLLGPTGINPAGVHNTLVLQEPFPFAEDEYGNFHWMKGPMTTQTLQDIIGKEPHHWRDDRDGIEEFSGAFRDLLGRDTSLCAADMLKLRNFLASVSFSPNPYRLLDNTLPGGPNLNGTGTNFNLDMTGFYSAPDPYNSKEFSCTGRPMELAAPAGGNAWKGFTDYVDKTFDGVFRCVDCHTLPIGAGPTHFMHKFKLPLDSEFKPIPLSVLGNAHQMMVDDETGQPHFKVPQLRNQIDKEGLFLDQGKNNPKLVFSRAGFGLLHDGSIDGLARFLSEPRPFQLNTDERLADMIAFNLAIAGGDFDLLLGLSGAPTIPFPPAAEDHTAHAAVGTQITIDSYNLSKTAMAAINAMIEWADAGKVDLIVKGADRRYRRGWYRLGKPLQTFQSDVNCMTSSLSQILACAGRCREITFTVVPIGSGRRMGVDRDGDTYFDLTERLHCTNPADPADHPCRGRRTVVCR